jgi:glyoxylate/hydroxypyruvate reductase
MAVLFFSTGDPPDEWSAELAKHLPQLDFRVWPDIGDPADITAAIVWRPPPGLLAGLPNLELIAVLGAGVDSLFIDPTLPADVPVVRLVDPYMTVAMCEYVQWQVLRLHRQDFAYRRQQQARAWRQLPQPNASERRVGVLGLGVLGSDAALKLKVLGFDVAGWSRSEKRLRGIPSFHGNDGLSALLARSEIIVCLLPLTANTTGILDRRLFAQLPRGAAIVTCARGRHLVENDLIEALASGQLSAAALDVFADEPLPPNHPFWNHPQIAVTPHVAAVTHAPTAAPVVAENLRRLAQGKPLLYRVDPSERY